MGVAAAIPAAIAVVGSLVGGGKNTSTQSSPKGTAKMLKEFRKAVTPLLKEQSAQFMEALTTGGVGARIPIIQKAVESSRQAASTANRTTSESIGRAGLDNTPFGEMVEGGVRQQGEQTIAGIPIDIIREILAQIPNFTLGTGSTVINAPQNRTTTQPVSEAFSQYAQGISSIYGAMK